MPGQDVFAVAYAGMGINCTRPPTCCALVARSHLLNCDLFPRLSIFRIEA